MREHGNNDKAAYGWCDLLDKEEWHEFIRDPLNDTKRAHFLDRMTYRLDKEDLSDADKTPESESMVRQIKRRSNNGRQARF